MSLLPIQIVIVIFAFFAGIPIARKIFPNKDDGFWHLFGFALSSIYFAMIVLAGILLHNLGIYFLVLSSTVIWIMFGIISARGYRLSDPFQTASIFYFVLILATIFYQYIMCLKLPFPHSGAVGYPIDNYIPFWVNDIIYHLKNPDSFRLYPQWHMSDRPVLFSIVETFFFHLFKIVPFSSATKYPDYIQPLYFYFSLSPILNCLVLIAAFWLLKELFNQKIAIFGTAIMALAPFTFINTYFSWPKYYATFFFLSSIYFMIRNENIVFISISLALSFLSHAMYIFFLPGFLIHYFLFQKKRNNNRQSMYSSLKLIGFFTLFILPWYIWVFLLYKNPSDKFLRFPFAIYYHTPEIMANTSAIIKSFLSTPIITIIWVRVVNAVQSLFPVSLGMVQNGYPSNVSGIYFNLLRFYWSSIPGTLFLSTLILCYYSLINNFKANRSFYFNFLVLPIILHLLFWGFATNTGHGGEMGRNDAHLFGPILAGLIAVETLKFPKYLLRFLIFLISVEFITVLYLNFDIICKDYRVGVFSRENIIVFILLLEYVLAIIFFLSKKMHQYENL
jgi:hypothetical protein